MTSQQYRQESRDIRTIKESKIPFHKFITLPDERKTEKVCWVALERDACCFIEIPNEIRTAEMAKTAVKKNGDLLKDIPPELMTKELCYEAICQKAEHLEYVPEELRSKAICRLALHNCEDGEEKKILKYIPYPDVCYDAIKQYNEIEGDRGFYLGNVIRELRPEAFSEELIRYIAQSDESGSAGDKIPEKYRPLLMELVLEKVANVTYNLFQLPHTCRDKSTHKILMQKNPQLYPYIFDYLKTKELCEVVLNETFYKDQELYFNYPSLMPYKDLQLQCLQRLENTEAIPRFLVSIGIKSITKEIAEEALSRNSQSLQFIPKTILTQEMVDNVLKRDPSAVKWTPIEYLNPANTIPAIYRQNSTPKMKL